MWPQGSRYTCVRMLRVLSVRACVRVRVWVRVKDTQTDVYIHKEKE